MKRYNSPTRQASHVLVIDSHPIMREGIVRVLTSALDGISAAGAESFPDALARTKRDRIDLVISDFRVQGEPVIAFLREILALEHKPRCLVLSDSEEILIGCSCARAGASGFVRKSAPVATVVDAVRMILAGGSYFSERLARALIAQPVRQTASSDGMHLTSREIEVFSHIGQGFTVSRIAAKLGVSVKTVQAHRENIKNKLSLQTANQVQAAAVRWLDETVPSI